MKYALEDQQMELEASLTHGLGLLLSVISIYFLFYLMPANTDSLMILGCRIYAITLILVYTISTMSHMYLFESINILLRRCDQGFIYLLIVGTATPFMSIMLSSPHTDIVARGRYICILLWSLAVIGCISKIVFGHRLHNVAISLYVLLGWGEAMALLFVRSEIERSALGWLMAGGCFYTIGVVFLVLDWQKYHFHTIWHLLVMAGSLSHFTSIMLLVT